MFNLEDQKYIKLLDLNAQIYTESKFNCKHIHLDSKSDEKVFMVALGLYLKILLVLHIYLNTLRFVDQKSILYEILFL